MRIMEKNNNNHLEDILSSLDGSQRASAPDFFYTRLKAKMEKGIPQKTPRSWQLKPAYVIAALLLVLGLNAAVLLNGKNEDNVFTADGTETAQQSIASEYSVFDNNIVYDLNQDK